MVSKLRLGAVQEFNRFLRTACACCALRRYLYTIASSPEVGVGALAARAESCVRWVWKGKRDALRLSVDVRAVSVFVRPAPLANSK